MDAVHSGLDRVDEWDEGGVATGVGAFAIEVSLNALERRRANCTDRLGNIPLHIDRIILTFRVWFRYKETIT
jgi:hypothetical protein